MADKSLEKILQFINENKTDDSLEVNNDVLLSLFSAFADELSQSGQLKLEELGTFHFLSGGSGLSRKVSFVPSKEIKFLLGDASVLGSGGGFEKKKEVFIPQNKGDQILPVSQSNVDQKELIVWAEAETGKKESNNTPKNENIIEVVDKNNTITSSGVDISDASKPSQRKKDTSLSDDQEKIERRRNRTRKVEQRYDDPEPSSGKGKSKFVGSFLILALMAVLVIFFIWYKNSKRSVEEENHGLIEFSDSVNAEKSKDSLEQRSIYTPPADTLGNEDSSQLFITTEKNSNLLQLSKKYYGSDVFWVYIYLENKGVVNDPVNLPDKVRLRIPKPDKKLMDADNPTCIKKANDLAVQILKY